MLATASCAEGFGSGEDGLAIFLNNDAVAAPAVAMDVAGTGAPADTGSDQCVLGNQMACTCADGASGLANCLSSGDFSTSCNCSTTAGDLAGTSGGSSGLSGGIAGTTAATGGGGLSGGAGLSGGIAGTTAATTGGGSCACQAWQMCIAGPTDPTVCCRSSPYTPCGT